MTTKFLSGNVDPARRIKMTPEIECAQEILMLRRHGLASSLAGLVFLLLVPCSYPQTSTKKKVTGQSDLPRFTYPVKGSASDLLQSDDATFNTFASKVRADLESTFRDYEVDDKATLRLLLQAKLDLQQLAGENQAALETVASLRAEEEKPAARLTTGLFTSAVLKAAIETRSSTGPDFEESFAKYYQESIDPLPWATVRDSIREQFTNYQLIGKAYVIGTVKTEIDPSAAKSGTVDAFQAWQLVGYRNYLQFVQVNNFGADVLRRYIAAHNVQKPDIWAAREVTLTADQKLTPVLVGIWDTGVDVSIFGDQVFTDPHPTASGTHGLAYDDQGNPSQSWLLPLTSKQQQQYPTALADHKGLHDLNDGIDSPEARALREKVSASTPEQMHDLFETFRVVQRYAHGTHVAGIAVRGNPSARLVVIRLLYGTDFPSPPVAPTEERTRRLAADARQVSEYLRTRNVRVVNMSWGYTPQDFESLLAKTSNEADPAVRKKRAGELYNGWRAAIESAIQNAPNTLFVCSAGNTDSDATFVDHMPSVFLLPNLIAVGAVNQAGDETDFTSYGSTVVVDADGYDVESTVPGGGTAKGSGTSMAAPNVANLAAKLFALDPSLSPEQVIDLIKRGATASEDGRRHLIDEKHSVALLKQQDKQ
jgi:subtilisin family serine protease